MGIALKPALLALDLQNDFFGDDNPNLAGFQATVPVINSAIGLFREHDCPVVFVQHVSLSKPAGSPAWGIHAGFCCHAEDARLSKTYANAFWNTELDALLVSHRVDFVALSGYLAEQCVLSTLRGAYERGFRGAILERSIASLDERLTRFTLAISGHISLEAFKADMGW